MEQANRRVLGTLKHLYSIVDAGEKGYAVAAADVNNRAVKLLFKTYARQRADFKAELKQAMQGIRAGTKPHGNLLAMIHRGRINIFAALTIGDENREQVVIREVLVGERAALRAYERALRQVLPDAVRDMMQRQYEEVQKVVEQVRLMRGMDGRRLVVRLYDSDGDAERAVRALRNAGFDSSVIEKAKAQQVTESYDTSLRDTMLETILSGAAGGALWGAVSGALAGFGVLHLPTLGLEHAPLLIQEQAWAETTLGAILAGTFVGGVIGTFIGWGVQSGDAYLYDQSLRRGRVLVRVVADEPRATQAWEILAQVNREARARGRHAMA